MQHFGALTKFVVKDAALQIRVMFKNQFDIADGLLGFAAFITFQHGAPHDIIPGGCAALASVLHGLQFSSLLAGLRLLYGLVVHGEVTHGLIAGPFVYGSVRRQIIVLSAEKVQAHKVKSVYQPPGAGVCRVVTVQKLPVIIKHCAARCTAACVGISLVSGVAGNVNGGQKLCDGGGYIVGAAERAHNTVFCCRVALPRYKVLDARQNAGNLWPFSGIVPVVERTENIIRRGWCGIAAVKDGVNIAAMRGPVHEAGCFKGGWVCPFHPDARGNTAGHGFIFIGGYSAVKRNNDAQARIIGTVLGGGIDRIGTAQSVDFLQQRLGLPRRDAVKVKCHQIAASYGSGLAPRPVKGAAHKAAHILERILLGLF